MQNRYAGDIGDYIKFALLRHLSVGKELGVAWYLFPDEGHNDDGKHTSYLSDPENWRHLDPALFDAFAKIVSSGRSIEALQRSKVLTATYVNVPLTSADMPTSKRSEFRTQWFKNTIQKLDKCNLVFADPDNGIVDDKETRRRQKVYGKQMPISEVTAISQGRTAVIYHHNTRYKGGHDAEVEHWFKRLGSNTIAVRANAYSCRTFFILNPDKEMTKRAKSFCDRWANNKVKLHLQS